MKRKLFSLLLAISMAAGTAVCPYYVERVFAGEQNVFFYGIKNERTVESAVTISFDTQGGLPISDIIMEQNARLTYLPVPYKSGYIFQGWYTGVNGTGMALEYGAVIHADMVYYACWTPVNRTLAGIAVSAGSNAYVGASVPSMLAVYAEYSDGTYERVYDYTVSQTTLYAGRNYITVSYRGFTQDIHIDVNAPQSDMPPSAVLTGIEAVYTAGALPVGTYDSFGGLVVNAYYSDGTTRAAEGYSLSSRRIEKGRNKITVAYGGKTADFFVTGYAYAVLRIVNVTGMPQAWVTEDTQLLSVLSDIIPTKTGYSFGGWYLDEACTQEVTAGMRTGTGKDIYAKWERIYSWSLNKTDAVMKKGREQKLSVSGLDNSEILWKSSDNKTASVSAKGVVKAKKKGRAVITAITKDGTVMTCTIKVKN